MPSFSRNGATITPRGSKVAADPDKDDQMKSVSMAIMKHHQGKTFRAIGKIYNLSHVAVQKRVRRVSPEVLAIYA